MEDAPNNQVPQPIFCEPTVRRKQISDIFKYLVFWGSAYHEAIRGKQGKKVEFGAKISVSLAGDGLAHVDKLHWHAQHEGHDLQEQVEAYKARYGYYPEGVMGDMAYGSQENRSFLKKRHSPVLGQTTWASDKDYARKQG